MCQEDLHFQEHKRRGDQHTDVNLVCRTFLMAVKQKPSFVLVMTLSKCFATLLGGTEIMTSVNLQNCDENTNIKGRRRLLLLKGQDYLKLMLHCHLLYSSGSSVKHLFSISGAVTQ